MGCSTSSSSKKVKKVKENAPSDNTNTNKREEIKIMNQTPEKKPNMPKKESTKEEKPRPKPTEKKKEKPEDPTISFKTEEIKQKPESPKREEEKKLSIKQPRKESIPQEIPANQSISFRADMMDRTAELVDHKTEGNMEDSNIQDVSMTLKQEADELTKKRLYLNYFLERDIFMVSEKLQAVVYSSLNSEEIKELIAEIERYDGTPRTEANLIDKSKNIPALNYLVEEHLEKDYDNFLNGGNRHNELKLILKLTLLLINSGKTKEIEEIKQSELEKIFFGFSVKPVNKLKIKTVLVNLVRFLAKMTFLLTREQSGDSSFQWLEECLTAHKEEIIELLREKKQKFTELDGFVFDFEGIEASVPGMFNLNRRTKEIFDYCMAKINFAFEGEEREMTLHSKLVSKIAKKVRYFLSTEAILKVFFNTGVKKVKAEMKARQLF